MCRSCDQGGRRCPGDSAEKRRARQNAAYHAKKHTTAPREPESGSGDASGSAGLAPLEGPVTPEVVRERVEYAQSVLARAEQRPSSVTEGAVETGEPLTTTDSQGWQVPTEYGLEAEAATRAAGAAVAARAEELAAPKLGGEPGRDKGVLGYMPEGAQSREEYVSFVQQRAESLKGEIAALRSEARTPNPSEDRSVLRQRSNDLVDEANKYLREAARGHQGDSAWDRVEARVYSDAYRQALVEQRDMGLPGGKMIEVDEASPKATVNRLKKGLAYYPSSWLDRDGSYEASWRSSGGIMGPVSGKQRVPLRVSSTSKRAHYSDMVAKTSIDPKNGFTRELYSELTIDKSDEGCLGPGVSTAVHEYGHRAERVQPQVNDLAQTHLARRTMGDDGQRHQMEPYLVGKARARSGPSQTMEEYEQRDEGKSEWTRPDDFAEQYSGKQNSSADNSSEVFTTGMEGVFAGRFGGLRGTGGWKEDREHRDFILGTLAAVR